MSGAGRGVSEERGKEEGKKSSGHQVSYVIDEQSRLHKENHLEYFYFCGQILAKAIYECIPIKFYLNRVIFKRLLNLPIVYADLQYVDRELWQSLRALEQNDIGEGDLISGFTLTQRDALTGAVITVELKPNGAHIPIDNSNKHEFIELLWQHCIVQSTAEQFHHLLAGFHTLLPQHFLSILDPDELELFLCGENSIDVNDWKSNTQYGGDFKVDHIIIQWFWAVLEKMSHAGLEKLLQFCTGSTRVPAEGFRGLTSNNGKICPFSIEPKKSDNPTKDFLVAHTCFNHIELPLYPSMQIMEENIHKLINSPYSFQFSFQ